MSGPGLRSTTVSSARFKQIETEASELKLKNIQLQKQIEEVQQVNQTEVETLKARVTSLTSENKGLTRAKTQMEQSHKAEIKDLMQSQAQQPQI